MVQQQVDSGRAHAKAKRYAEAADAFGAAVALAPKNAQLQSEYGWLLFLANEPYRAETAIRGALPQLKAPEQGAALYNLGRVFEATSRPDDAERAYVRSLELRPNNKTVELRLAAVRASRSVQGATLTGDVSSAPDRNPFVPCRIDVETGADMDAEGNPDVPGGFTRYEVSHGRAKSWSAARAGSTVALPPLSEGQLRAIGATRSATDGSLTVDPTRLGLQPPASVAYHLDQKGRTVKVGYIEDTEKTQITSHTYTYHYTCQGLPKGLKNLRAVPRRR